MAIRRLALLHVLRDVNIAPNLFRQPGEFREDIVDALDPSREAVRFGRTWRLSRPQIFGGRWLQAKLGFVQSLEAQNIYYDEALQDWVAQGAPSATGTFSHFVLDLESQYLLFDYKPPDIQIQSFKGAFENILRQTYDDYRLTAEAVSDEEEFFRWLDEMDQVSVIHLSLRRPNPSFRGRQEAVLQLLQETNSGTVEIRARAASAEESLIVQGTDLETLANYAAEGYGKVTAKGRRGVRVRRYDSAKNVRETQVETQPGEQSVSIFEKIRAALQSII